MNDCTKFREAMMMDVYGELSQGEKEWEEHLRKCFKCSRERDRLKALLGMIEEGWRESCPLGYDGKKLTSSIMERIEGLDRKRWMEWSRIPSPALAVAFTLCLVIGFVAWQYLQESGGGKLALREPEEQFWAENSELFEEMELLEEMDLVQKIVQLIDREEAKM